MVHDFGQIVRVGTQLEPAGRSRSTPRSRHLFCVDEPRQHATAFSRRAIYKNTSQATSVLAGLEWSAWGPDFLRGFRIPHYVHNASSLGFALARQRASFLSDEVRPHCAITACAVGDIECPSSCACQTLYRSPRDRRTRACPDGSTYLPYQRTGSSTGLSPWQLGHSLVPVRRGDVLYLFPTDVQTARSRKTVYCSASRFRGDGSLRSDVS